MTLKQIQEASPQLKKRTPHEFWRLYAKAPKELKPDLIITRAYTDLKFFAKIFLKHHISASFNQFHKDYFRAFNPIELDKKLNVLSPRASAKTTLLALIDVLHRICYSTEKFIVILSAVEVHAKNKLKDLRHEVVGNKFLHSYYGLAPIGRKILAEEIEVQSRFGETKVISQGFFSQIRGLKWREHRPTRFIYDDIAHGERVFSEEQRKKAQRHFDTDIHFAGTPQTNHINIATALHHEDISMQLQLNPAWKSWKYRSIITWPKNENLWKQWEKILSNMDNENREKESDMFYVEHKKEMDEGAKVMWPDREPLLYLRKEIVRGGIRKFNAEKQMIPFLSGESLFKDITWFDEDKFNFKSGLYGAFYSLDPATGEERRVASHKNLSDSARLIGYQNLRSGILYIVKDFVNRDSPVKIIEEMFTLNEEYNFMRMGVEENLWKGLYKHAIELVGKKFEKEGKNYKKPHLYQVYQPHKIKRKSVYILWSLKSPLGKFSFQKT